MLDGLVDLVWRLGTWGYALVFLAAALECSAFMGFLVPGETLVILSGVLVSAGVFDVAPLIAVVAGGAILGDSVGYWLGRSFGRPWLEHRGGWVGLHRDRLDDVDTFFARHGGKAVLFGRFIGFLRAFAPFVAGASRMPYRRFLVFDATGAILWAVAFVMLGYGLGESWRVAERWIGRAGLAAGVLAVGAAVWWIRRQRRRAR